MSRVLYSMRGLAWILGVPLERLREIAAHADNHYHPFEQRRPGKSRRQIDNPDEDIKDVQKRIRAKFLADQPLDRSVRACVKGGSPLKNAIVHQNKATLGRVDVKKCYPSITNTMTYRVLRGLGFGPKPAALVTRLATRNGHLPQGAPTSDMLANLYLRGVDERVKEIVASLGLENSRCMDDIAVSGDGNTRNAIGPIIEALRAHGLAVRHRKTGVAGGGQPHVITGYGVNGPGGPKVPPTKVQEIRTDVYQLVGAFKRGERIDERLASVRGSLAYLRRTNLGVVLRLERQMSAAGVPFKVKASKRVNGRRSN